MTTVIYERHAVIYDEFGWGNTTFYPSDIAKELIKNHLSIIRFVEFLNVERAILINIETAFGTIDYWFHNIDYDLLNFFCGISKFRQVVRKFIMDTKLISFDVGKYPLIVATILGNNNEY